jgi:hypothetical protein
MSVLGSHSPIAPGRRAVIPRRALSGPVAVGAGGLLVAVGVLGFVPGITSHAGSLAFAGRGSHAELFGQFWVSVLLNLVHVASGLPAVVLARTDSGARTYLTACGVFYVALWVLGPLRLGGWLPVNAADNWLHLLTGCALLGLGSLLASAGRR